MTCHDTNAIFFMMMGISTISLIAGVFFSPIIQSLRSLKAKNEKKPELELKPKLHTRFYQIGQIYLRESERTTFHPLVTRYETLDMVTRSAATNYLLKNPELRQYFEKMEIHIYGEDKTYLGTKHVPCAKPRDESC